jgi:hypothetical protein
MTRCLTIPGILATALLGAPLALAGEEADSRGIAFFEARIRPVLSKQCYACHSEKADRIRGGPLLDSRLGLRKGGDRGPAMGRGHNSYGWSLWLAGGGVKRGIRHVRTDDFGFQAVENPVHVHDLHATILHLLGLDHERLTYRHAGRDFRLTDIHGRVVKEILT